MYGRNKSSSDLGDVDETVAFGSAYIKRSCELRLRSTSSSSSEITSSPSALRRRAEIEFQRSTFND